jgi:cytochrome c
LTRIVLEGSNPYSSHWKNKAAGIAMPPNAVAITESDARQVVYWILSLK